MLSNVVKANNLTTYIIKSVEILTMQFERYVQHLYFCPTLGKYLLMLFTEVARAKLTTELQEGAEYMDMTAGEPKSRGNMFFVEI